MFDFEGMFFWLAFWCFIAGMLACAALFGLYELAVYVIHHLAWVKP
jgi:hypothetical protein